jgi:pyruvate/2-oxoglutarate/acetoin dehydrogenase E1 component
MTYKEIISDSLTEISKDDKIVHIGYNVLYGHAGGVLDGVKEEQMMETPVAENLMMGVAIGMSLEGFLPVVHFERMDFILNALDAIVNHLDKMEKMSRGEFRPACIIRCVVGNTKKPLYTGLTHTQDLTNALIEMVDMPVITLNHPPIIKERYVRAYNDMKLRHKSTIIVEYKDKWDEK